MTEQNTPNDTRLEDSLKEVRKLGGTHADGNEALTRLGLLAAENYKDGVWSLDKDSTKKDTADTVYDEYLKGFSKKATSDHTPNGMAANKSKLRAIGKAAIKTGCDFPEVCDRSLRIRKEEDSNGQKTHGPYAVIVSAARVQQKQDDSLTDEQIRELVLKDGPKERTVEGQLKKAQKILHDLITGEHAGVQDQDANTIAAQEALDTRLAMFTVERDAVTAREVIAKLGWQVVETSVE